MLDGTDPQNVAGTDVDDVESRTSIWHPECAIALNKQIALELWASIQYHAMFAYFHRTDVSLVNIANLFNNESLEERAHAHKMIEYQNTRGGRAVYDVALINTIRDLGMKHEFERTAFRTDVQHAFEEALDIEKLVFKRLRELHATAELYQDAHFCDFIASTFLTEQVNSIEGLTRTISHLKRARSPRGHATLVFEANQRHVTK